MKQFIQTQINKIAWKRLSILIIILTLFSGVPNSLKRSDSALGYNLGYALGLYLVLTPLGMIATKSRNS